MKKRGLSSVVSTVLLILIAISAVALIIILIRALTSPAEDLSTQIEISLQNEQYIIVSNSVKFYTSGDAKYIDMNIRRKLNSPTPIAFYVILEDKGGASVSHRVNITLNEYEEKKVTVDYTNDALATMSRIILVPIFLTPKGKEITPSLTLISPAQKNSQLSATSSSGGGSGGSYIYVVLPSRECSDGIDNDGDGFADSNDYGCIFSGTTEWIDYKFQCADGIDNNGNGKIDMADSNCLSPYDDFEGTAPQHNEDEAMLFPTTVSV
ncbi:hypothetical protein KW787_03600, partial [Candidatus Pacearchaeota archaeon]|nr:hypothetical protein [Candidatus Pacearchaeota archaeon]